MFRSPYPGLRSFNRDESDLFFGRDGCVEQMVNRLADTRFLAVLGTSGTGKSSLVKTGLLDALELGTHPAGSDWRIRLFSPAGDPFAGLTESLLGDREAPTPEVRERLNNFLRRGPRSLVEWANDGNLTPGTNLLLLVDQFEELFRFDSYSEREDAEAFAKLLICSAETTAAAIHVVITMRSEFLGACALIPGLADTISRGLYLVPRMTRSECESAIVGPARVTGFKVEPALVTRVLNDMESFAPWTDDHEIDPVRRISRRADQLPVMQHVLNRMASRVQSESHGRVLKLEHYEQLGGVRGALDAHGKELLAVAGPERRDLVERVFRALVAGDSPEAATRRPLALRDIVSSTGADRIDVIGVLDVFRANDANFLGPSLDVRLTDRTVIDISHESLIRQWSMLSEWVSREAMSADSWRRLASRAEHYARGRGELLVGLDLTNLDDWWKTERPQPDWSVRYGGNFRIVAEFLDRSVTDEEQRRNAELEREKREKERLKEALDTATNNLGLAISATEILAIDFARNLETNKDVDTAAKLMFVEDIEKRFDQMSRGRESNSDLLSRKADLLITNARMLTEVGYLDRAGQRAAAAHALLFPTTGVELPGLGDALKAKAKLMWAEALWYRRSLAAAQTALDEARSNLSHVTNPGWEEAILSARAGTLQADLHDAHDRYHDEVVEIERTIAEAQRFAASTDNATPSASRQVLNEIVGSLYAIRVRTLGKAGLDTTTQLVDFSAFVDEHFRDVDQPGSHYLRSTLKGLVELLQANQLFDQGKAQQALSLADRAVSDFDQLCAKDWQNLASRRELARTLLRRARIARSLKNFPRALADVASARAIAYHVKLDDALPAATLAIDVWADYQSGQNAEAAGKPENALAEYRRIGARLNLFADLCSREDLARCFGAYEAWGAMTKTQLDAARIREVLELSKSRLALYSAEPISEEDRSYAAMQRYYALSRLLEWGPGAVGVEDWNRYFDTVMKDTSYLAAVTEQGQRWLLWKANYVGTKAFYLRNELKDLPAAMDAFVEALGISLPLMRAPKLYASAAQSAVYHLWSGLDLLPGSAMSDRIVEMLAQFIDTVIELHASRSGNLGEDLTATLTTKVAACAEQLKANPETDERVLTGLLKQQERLAGLHEVKVKVSPDLSPTADTHAGSIDFKELDLGYAGALEAVRMVGGARINWSAAPLFAATWRTLVDLERDHALEQFVAAKVLTRREITQHVVRVRTALVDFYDRGYLLDAEVERENGPRLYTLLVVRDAPAYVLDGKSPPIHTANSQGGLLLDTPNRVAGYLRFFCSYVTGEEGSFQVVEYVNDLIWDGTADQSIRDTVARVLRPVVVWRSQKSEDDKEPSWNATATIQYSNALFFARFEIQTNGMVTMPKDQPIVTDLPINPIRVTASGRTSEPVKRVSVIRQGIMAFDDDRSFLSHLLTLPPNRRPKSYDWLVKETVELLCINTADAKGLNSTSYKLIKAEVLLNRAVALAEQVNAISPSDPDFMETLAWGYTKVGRLSEAIKLFKNALPLYKEKASTNNAAEAHAHLGQAYRLIGDGVEARSALETARSLNPSSEISVFIAQELRILETNSTTSDAQ